MPTPSRTDGKVIDFAAHFHPDDPPENEYAHKFVRRDLGHVYRDIDAFVACYDEAGIDGAVLSQPFYMGYHDLERTRAANDAMVEAIDGLEDYYGLAAIPTAAGGVAAAEEFERCLDRGLHGGALETKTDGIELHHEAIEPVLEVADRTGAPILVHPKLLDSLGPDVLDDTWMLNAVFGREVALMESLCKVVHTGVLDRYPELDLVYHHTGGNLASMLGRYHNQFVKFPPEDWAAAEPDQLKRFPAFKAQLEERIYLDTSGYFGYNNVLRSAVAAFPSSQILFGTDFPFETRLAPEFEKIVTAIEEEASRTDAERMLGGNALDLLVNVD